MLDKRRCLLQNGKRISEGLYREANLSSNQHMPNKGTDFLGPRYVETYKGRYGRLWNNCFQKTNPDMKELFPKIITINEENRLEFVIDEKMLQKHATTVMEGLGAAVESLNNPYVLDNVLKAVGQTHARRQVKPIMLKKLWPPLDFALSEVLQDQYTKEVADAWRKVYDYICLRMKEGMKDTDDDMT